MTDPLQTRSLMVVLNDEEQYSIRLADRDLPSGLAGRWFHGRRGRVPGLYRGNLDRHAASVVLRRWMADHEQHDHEQASA